MFSREFMRYLINYQKEEFTCAEEKHVKEIRFKSGNGRFAIEYLINKK